MTTRHLVDPELLALVDAMPPMVLSDESLPVIRAALPAMVKAVPTHRLMPRLHGPAILPGCRARSSVSARSICSWTNVSTTQAA